VVEGGVIDMVCFDKTGTLTEDGMILKGILLSGEEKILSVKNIEGIYNNLTKNDILLNCISTCHSVISHEGKLIGDEMEIELLKVTRSDLIRLENGDYHVRSYSGKDLKI
jgi:cation-transporting P-type ATPase 13A2